MLITEIFSLIASWDFMPQSPSQWLGFFWYEGRGSGGKATWPSPLELTDKWSLRGGTTKQSDSYPFHW